ncbi:MAG: hypothetical protein L3J75_09110 [Methylococcaceae bacterium]|nr:hypothetical protein [Methylococcaceae bacterium]
MNKTVIGGFYVNQYNGELSQHINRILTEFLLTAEFREITQKIRVKHNNIIIKNASETEVRSPGLKFESHNYRNIVYISTSEYRAFKTQLPDDFERNFSHIKNDDKYWQAYDEFVNDYPEFYRLSLQRTLFHEIQHSGQVGFNINTKYLVSPETYENPIINKTNKYMQKYYKEPLRLNHRDHITQNSEKKWLIHLPRIKK